MHTFGGDELLVQALRERSKDTAARECYASEHTVPVHHIPCRSTLHGSVESTPFYTCALSEWCQNDEVTNDVTMVDLKMLDATVTY